MRRVLPLALVFLSPTLLLGQTYIDIQKLIASDRDSIDRFGWDVDISGDYAVVGAYGDDFGSNNPNMGSAYVYERVGNGVWVEVQKLIASDQQDYDRFGYSVAISGDYIIVGSYQQNEDELGNNPLSNAGAAYIYERDGGGTWNEVQKIVASDRGVDDEFGHCVDIDSNYAVVGAHLEDEDANDMNTLVDPGSAYVFERDGAGTWNEVEKVVAGDRASDPNGFEGDHFGAAVAISRYGYLAVGAYFHDYGPLGPGTGFLWSSGAVFMFERDGGGNWNEVQKIQNFDREGWDRFGFAVSVDSNLLVVGAYSEDEVADGVSNPLTNPGSAYIYERDGAGVWNHHQKIVPNDRNSGDHFGWDVDISGDFIVLGCHQDDHDSTLLDTMFNAGSAYVFQVDGGGMWNQLQKIDAADRRPEDEFGISCAISGANLIIGAFQQDLDTVAMDSLVDAGAAYILSNNLCELSSITTNQSPSVCFGGSYTVGTNTYTATGTYIDVLMAANGCDSTVTTNLTVDPEIDSTQSVAICFGGSYSIGTSTYTTSGTYVDTLTASGGCDSTVTTNLTVNPPVDASLSQVFEVITANATGMTYQWVDCNNNMAALPGETNQVFTATMLGAYAVVVSDGTCSDTSSCVLVDGFNGITDPSDQINIVIAPNPNDGDFRLTIRGTEDPNYRVQILNAAGQLVRDEKVPATGDLHITGLASGIYSLRLSSATGTMNQKFVVR